MTQLIAATGDSIARIHQEERSSHVEIMLAGSGVQCLALDPHHPGAIFAGSRGKGVFKSTDGGVQWDSLEFPHPDVFSLAVSAADGAVYAGCEPSMLFVSRDSGQSWQELESLQSIPSKPHWSFPPRPWTSHVRWIAPNPHDPDLILVGIELGGLMVSSDGGKSWLDHRPGAQKDVHALAWHPTVRGRGYEAGGGGAAWSKDGGQTWEPADAGRDRHYTWALAVDPADPDCWFISASPGPDRAHRPGNAEAFVYRWQGAGPWQRMDGGLPQPLRNMPYALAFGSAQLYAGMSNGQVYASADHGDHWESLSLEENAIPCITALAVLQ